jgi:membrane peptidoglycan carboxypeptidase
MTRTRRLVKFLLLIALGIPSVLIFILLVSGLYQYASLKNSALETIQGWHQEKSWHALVDFPPKLVNTVIAVYDPNLRTREECLSIWNQLGMFQHGRHADGTHLSHNAARFLQSQWQQVKTIQWHINGLLLTHFFDCSYPREGLLEVFLNRAFMGNDREEQIRGFHRASEFYFSKRLDELSTSQIALLVAITYSPVAYNPRIKAEAALRQRGYVLSRMAVAAVISNDEANLASKTSVLE